MTIGRLPQIIYSPNSNTGISTPGARMSFYEAGSTTNLKAIFSDFASTPLVNPVFADGLGRFPNIVLDDATGGYNVQFSTSDGATTPTFTQVYFEDNVSFAGSDPLLLGDGTAGAPPYSFASEPTTGFYLAASGQLASTVLGNQIGVWNAQGLNIATSGESATPSLYLEGDIDTGWRQDGVNNWTFSALGQDQMSISAGLLELPGTTIGGNVLKLGAKTGQDSIFRSQGDDIAQPMTVFGEANSYYEFRPLSTTLGGGLVTGFSSGNAAPLVVRGFIGSTAPSTTIPAIQLRAGKSDGSTGIADLASTELAFSLANSTGSNSLFSIFGGGDITAAGNLQLDGDITIGDGTGAAVILLNAGGADKNPWNIFASDQSSASRLGFTDNTTGLTPISMNGDSGATTFGGPIIVSTGTTTLNLPSSAGVSGTLYSNSGVVTVSP